MTPPDPDINRLWSDNNTVITSIVHSSHRRFRNWVDWNDLYQEAALWWFDTRNASKILEYLEDPKDRRLGAALRNRLQTVGEHAKAEKSGYSPDDVYWFDAKQVADLLVAYLDDNYDPPQPEGETRAPSDPAHGGEHLTSVVDVGRAYAKLSATDRGFLAEYHEAPSRLTDEDTEAARVRYWRTIGRLTNKLGGRRPEGWNQGGRRKVMSNAAWAATTQAQTDG